MERTMGQIIKSLRKNSGLTQEELAEQLNISAPAVSKWESNTAMPDISQVVPLADIFGVTTDYLFGLSDTTVEEEAFRIVQDAQRLYLREHPETYLLAYEKISEGLKNIRTIYCCWSTVWNTGWLCLSPKTEIFSAPKRQRQLPMKQSVRQNWWSRIPKVQQIL